MKTFQKLDSPFRRNPTNPRLLSDEWRNPTIGMLADYPIWEATEKIDGCLHPKTSIRMADGTRKYIKDIKAGEYVLGYEDGRVRAVEVQATANQEAAGTWVKLKITRNGLGKGNSFGQVICTHDHRIWTPDRGYVEAWQLRPGDRVLTSRTDLSLAPIQEQVLTGKMLGDGTLVRKDDSQTASVEFSHALPALTDWTLRGVGELAGSTRTVTSGYGSTLLRGRTTQGRAIYETFRHWIDENGVKEVPDGVQLTPISLAFWYMDDGALATHSGQEDRAVLSTNGFSEESISHLQEALRVLGMESVAYDNNGWVLRLNATEAEKLFLMVAPYIPEPLQYKLPERYRGHEGWLPPANTKPFQSLAVEQRVISVTKEEVSYRRCDLQTETKNFFTTAALVHNTNIRIGWDGYRITFGGRTDNADTSKVLLDALAAIFHADGIEEWFEENFPVGPNGESPEVVLYGEGYGPGTVKGSSKYVKESSFVGFDISVGERYFAPSSVRDIFKILGVKTVPVLATGVTLTSLIDTVRGGLNSTYGDFLAEGLVARTVEPLYDQRGSRLIVKLKPENLPSLPDAE